MCPCGMPSIMSSEFGLNGIWHGRNTIGRAKCAFVNTIRCLHEHALCSVLDGDRHRREADWFKAGIIAKPMRESYLSVE